MQCLRKILATLIFVAIITVIFKPPAISGQISHVKRFRILALECTFDSIRMKSAQHLIEAFLEYPNWENTTEYQVCIHLLSLYEYNELNDTCKPFYQGLPTKENIQYEIENFLGQAVPGEIVILYYCGHGQNKVLADPGISASELTSWLNSGGLPQACVIVILDTCHSGSWIEDGGGRAGILGPNRVVLTACKASEYAWGGPDYCGVFTYFINEGTYMATDVDNDGWLSTTELFEYAKPKTEQYVIWAVQTPTSYYGIVEGDVPLIQRNTTKAFPERNISILSANVSSNSITAGFPINIGCLVKNWGSKTGTFSFHAYYNASNYIGNQTASINPNENRSFIFSWDTTGMCNGTYIISVLASITPCESNVTDNSYIDGAVYIQQKGILLVPSQYSTIQEAVDNASPKDTIKVDSGVYYEHLIIDKSIVLLGENSTTSVIDGNSTGTAIYVVADNVTISHFTIRNSSYGLFFSNSSNNFLHNNVITLNSHGLFLQQSGNNVLSNNTLTANHYNIGIRGVELSHFINFVDDSNTVNGKPICYLINQHDTEIAADVGFIALVNSTNIRVRNVNLQNNYDGILFVNTNNSIVEDSKITGTFYGISFIFSAKNVVAYNTIANGTYGVMGLFSSQCTFFHNNFINNTNAAYVHESLFTWDNGYEGNFWSDYLGIDSDQDGIGDFPYPVVKSQGDEFPLMGLSWKFNAGTWNETTYHVTAISTSIIKDFNFDSESMTISLNVSSLTDTSSFCRVNIPKNLLYCPEGLDRWLILFDDEDVSAECNIWQNSTHTFIYISYSHSFHKIEIKGTKAIPEFSIVTLIPVFIVLALVAVLTANKIIAIRNNYKRS